MSVRNKVALLSHRTGNIGHLFMSVGFEEIIKKMFGERVDIVNFEQHRFFSVYQEGHWLHLIDKVPHGRMKAIRMWLNSPAMCQRLWPQAKNLKGYSGVIACGGPSIVRGVGKTPEMCLMFHHQLGAFHFHDVPTFDCGVGSGGFPLSNLPLSASLAFDEADRAYFERLFSYSTISTVRDAYAQELWRALGRNAPLIPCGAIASGRRFDSLAKSSFSENEKHIIINYQRCGANSDWGQKVNVEKWRGIVAQLIRRLKKRHKVIFVCHNEFEAKDAARVGVNIPRIVPKTLAEYASVIVNGKAGLASRIHAAIPMAGIGLPVSAVGTDTRLGTLDLMGLKTHYVEDITSEQLEEEIEAGIVNRISERERLLTLREETMDRYIEIFAKHMSR